MDAANEFSSPWQLLAEPAAAPSPVSTAGTEVVVAGAGIVGATVALRLAQAGHGVTLLDSRDPLAWSTAAHSTVKATIGQGTLLAKLAASRGDDVALAYVRMQQSGIAELRSLAAQCAPQAGLQEIAQLVYAQAGSSAEKISKAAQLARLAGIEVGQDESAAPGKPARAYRYPGLMFHPGQLLAGILQAARAAGVRISLNSRVTGVEGSGPVRVQISGGQTITAQKIVLATHSPILLRGGHFAHLKARRHYGITAVLRDHPSDLMTYDVTGPTYSTRPLGAHGLPGEVVVVGAAHDTGTHADGDPWESLAAWADRTYGLQQVTRRWAAQDFTTPDSAPLIGAISGWDNRIFMVSGANAWGFATAMFAAHALARALAKQPAQNDDLWSPNRLGGARGLLKTATWQGEVAGRLVTGLASGARTEMTAEELPAGQAAILRDGLEQVAAYRDETGQLHQVSARCTHMGCTVAWNRHEKSWDCPCHGSRFDVDGAVLNSPAREPLAPH